MDFTVKCYTFENIVQHFLQPYVIFNKLYVVILKYVPWVAESLDYLPSE